MNQVMTNISLNTLLRECKKENKSDRDIKKDLSEINGSNIHEVFGYRFYEDDLINTLDIYHDGNHIIGYIIPSYEELLKKVWKYLLKESVPEHIEDNEELTARLTERLNVLKGLSLPIELCTEENAFYLIDEYYNKGIEYHKKIKRLEKLGKKNTEEHKKIKEFYYSKAFYPCYEEYIQKQSLFFKRLINKRKEYKALIKKQSLNKIMNDSFDMNKVAMYIVHTYLVKCEEATDHATILKYYRLVEKYKETSEYRKDVFLKTDEGIQLNWDNIQRRMRYIEQKLQDYEVNVNWRIVPPGQNNRVQQSGYPKKIILSSEQAKKIAELQQVGEDKRKFYESTGYELKARGLRQNHGYVAYIYRNGIVLLDREYDENAPSSAKGNAIFVINAINFKALSQLDKTSLRNNPNVKRINHVGYWKDRVNELIYSEGNLEEQEAVLTLKKEFKKRV